MAYPDIDDVLAQYTEAKNIRSGIEQQWRLNAAYCLPREYAEWSTDGQPVSLNRLNSTQRYAYDGTGAKSVPQYGSVLNRLITPEGQKYHIMEADNEDVRKIYAVRVWFNDLNSKLFSMRQQPAALFKQMQGELYTQLGVYGTACKSIMWRAATPQTPRGGFAYKTWAMRDVFLVVDDEGRVVGIFRRFYLTPRNFKRKWPNVTPPKSIADADNENSRDSKYVEFLHAVMHRMDYEKGALDIRRHPWQGCHIAVSDKQFVGPEQGFLSNPYNTPRTSTSSTSPYGYSPAELAFPALGSANAMKKTVIKQGHKAVDPTLLANDDGALSGRIDTRPNAIIYGGLNNAGQKLVQPLDVGSNFQVAQELLNDEREDIANNFLSVLFRILEEKPDMTAAAVYETVAKEGALVAPLMGRLQSEDLEPQIMREIGLLVEHGMLPQMPPELIEARGEYSITYTSPLAKAMYAEEVSGFMRLSETATGIAAAQGDPSALDHFDYDTAIPAIADRMNVPASWMAHPDKVAAKREERAKRFEMEQMVKAAPAAASVAASAMKTQQGKNVG